MDGWFKFCWINGVDLAGSYLRAYFNKDQSLSYTVPSLFLVTDACPACLAGSRIIETSSGSRWRVEKLIELLDHVCDLGLITLG